MRTHLKACLLMTGCLLLAGCGGAESTLATSTILAESTSVPSSLAPSESTPTFTEPVPTEIPVVETVPEEPSITEILAQLESINIDDFFEESYRQLQLRDPDQLFLDGLADDYGLPNDRFSDLSADYLRDTHQLETGVLDMLRSYDRSELSPDQQLSYDIYEWYLDDLVRGHPFQYYDYPVNSLTIWGKQNWLVDLLANQFPIRNKEDADNYLARLSQIDIWADQLIEGLKLREEAGVIPPDYLIRDSIEQIEGHIIPIGPDSYFVKGNELYTSFRDKLDSTAGITNQEKQVLVERALEEIENAFIPAFLKLKTYLEYLETKASSKSGLLQYPDGQAYYAYMLGHEAGTEMSPEQIHELGREEVARLQREMQQAAVQLGYPTNMDLADLQERLITDSDVLQGESMLVEFQGLIDKANQATDAYFDLLPEGDLIIKPEPFGAGIGYYQSPPLDGSGPGVFYTNFEMEMPSHLAPSYIYHETVPGHHLQIALARELDLPTFRRALVYNAYAEGWAVYAERLAWEMGLYEDDPLGNLGRLDFELARAARLVVDTGIHALGWTRQQAADYYEEATGRPSHPVAMHRYVVLPGQGCGYTIGMHKILELRQSAMDQLGEEFDIKAFHNLILGQGSLPLGILEDVVDEWIADQLN